MRRFYASKDSISSNKITLSGQETHHLVRVDRFKKGDTVLVFDGEGNEYKSAFSGLKNGCAVLEIKSKIEREKSLYTVKAAVCLPKRSKFETIIEKCTELDVEEVIPLISERTVVKIDNSKAEDKLKRWQRKAIEASKQANRAKFPVIRKPCRFNEFVESVPADDFVLIPTLYSNNSFKQVFKDIKDYKNITVLIGPEGGFSLQEVAFAEEKGAVAVSLGSTVLRVETAVIFTVSVIRYEIES